VYSAVGYPFLRRFFTGSITGSKRSVHEYCALDRTILRRPQKNLLNLPCIPAKPFKAPDQSIIGVLSILTIRAPEVELSGEARPSTSG